MKQYEKLAIFLEDNARCPEDNEAAAVLRKQGKICDAAYEMIMAKTHEHSRDSYDLMRKLIKGEVA
jgi:hypothetical protein